MVQHWVPKAMAPMVVPPDLIENIPRDVELLLLYPVRPPGYRSHVYTDLSEKTGNQLFDSFAVAR